LDAQELREQFKQYLREAALHDRAGRVDAAWANLEAAHIVGQEHTALHVHAHVEMARLAWRHRDVAEWFGQLGRMLAAALITWVWVPRGNTGRASISPFARMEIPHDLAGFGGRKRRKRS